jgi:hypothetical protein
VNDLSKSVIIDIFQVLSVLHLWERCGSYVHKFKSGVVGAGEICT